MHIYWEKFYTSYSIYLLKCFKINFNQQSFCYFQRIGQQSRKQQKSTQRTSFFDS